MRFDELNEDNHLLFAIKHYENPHASTMEEFEEDLKRFKYIKRLLKKYLEQNELRHHLILNHLIILNYVSKQEFPIFLFYFLKDLVSIAYFGVLILNSLFVRS